MTINNDFLPLANSGSANVISQSTYAALASLLANGFSSGIAQSNQVNKVLRQTTAIAALIGQFMQAFGQNANDDGNAGVLLNNFTLAVETAVVNYVNANAGLITGLTGNLKSANNLSDLGTLTTALTNLGFSATTNSFKIPNANNSTTPFIIKMGQSTISSGTSAAFSFPIAFPNALLSIVGSDIGSSTVPMGVSGNTTTYTVYLPSAVTKTFNWIAVGN